MDSDIVTSRWTLVRHGQTFHNEQGIIQGQSVPAELNPNGVKQAQELGIYLSAKPRPNPYLYDLVVVSDLHRAQQTANGILASVDPANKIPRRPEPRIRERSFGSLEGQPRSIVHSTLNTKDVSEFKAETVKQLKARTKDFARELLQELNLHTMNHSEILIVSHGGTIGEFLTALSSDFPGMPTISSRPPNTSRSIIQFRWRRTPASDAKRRTKSQLPQLLNLTVTCEMLYDLAHLQ